MVYFPTGNRRQQLAHDIYLFIESVNRQANLLTVRDQYSRIKELSCARWKNVQAYQRDQRELAVRRPYSISYPRQETPCRQWRIRHDYPARRGNARLVFDSRRKLTMPRVQLRHMDYGYCSTSHASQGATVDRVMVNVDSMRSHKLVNQQQFMYRSCARHDAQIFTNDRQGLEQAVDRQSQKTKRWRSSDRPGNDPMRTIAMGLPLSLGQGV